MLLLIDKPRGPTSHDVVTMVKRHLHADKAGHAGTLDPMATGLLIIGINKETRLLGDVVGQDKEYRATLKLGTKTDTQDADGRPIETGPVPDFTAEKISEIMRSLIGELELQVPAYSAIRQKGVPLYKLARRGVVTQLPVRRTNIFTMTLEDWQSPQLTFSVKCSTGTYVRALGEELAYRLGTVGHLAALRRIAVGSYHVNAATPLAALLLKR